MSHSWRRTPLSLSLVLSLSLAGLLGGCSALPAVGPDYRAPIAATLLPDSQWQAALPHEGQDARLIDWWRSFDDPVLLALLTRAEADSPNLAEAVARIDEARAALGGTDAPHWPALTAGGHVTRNNGSAELPQPVMTTHGIRLDARWEIDLFGHVRRANEAASARLDSQQQRWHAARVTLAAEVASQYVNYHVCRQTQRTLQADLQSRRATARIVSEAATAGLSAPAEARLAHASAAAAADAAAAQEAACVLLQKSLVTLTGLDHEALRALLDQAPAQLPQPRTFRVASLPLAWLAQRPDLAASERQLAAASADIGVATAHRYPRLALVGNLTRDKSHPDDGPALLARPWFFGPSLSLPLFDGGALAANQQAAQARYAQALARYRQAVRAAVEEVETALVLLDAAATRSDEAHIAAEGYRAHFAANEQHWRAGGISLLTLEESRRLSSQAERQEIARQQERVLHWIALYKALGGGWQADRPPPAPIAESAPAPAAPNTLARTGDLLP